MPELEDLDTLKSDPQVLRVYGSFLKLIKAGNGSYKALCPFHSEKTESFTIYPDGRAHCFGCSVDMNIFQFLEKIEGISFKEAVAKVKQELGKSDWGQTKATVESVFKSVAPDKVYKTIPLSNFSKLETALSQSVTAREFLAGRGITLETAKKLHIGFSANIGNLAGQDGADIADKGWLAFPSIEGDQVVSIKYRSIIRKKPGGFARQPGMATALWNSESVDVFEPVYLTEGECLLGDTEVLTPYGWVRLDTYSGQSVVQWQTGGASSFVKPLAYVNSEFNGQMVRFSTASGLVNQVVTPSHRVLYCDEKLRGKAEENTPIVSKAVDVPDRGARFLRTCELETEGIALSDIGIRLQVMVQADASVESLAANKDIEGRSWQAINMDGWRIEVKKTRKIERIRHLLSLADIPFEEYKTKRGNMLFRFKTNPGQFHKRFPALFYQMDGRQRRVFLDELQYWDSHTTKAGVRMYVSTVKENSDLVQTIFVTSGISTKFGVEVRGGTRQDKYWVSVSLRDKRGRHDLTSGTTVKKTREWYEGPVYCLTVPSSFLLIRRNGVVSVTGNCDAAVMEQAGFHAVSVPSAGVKLSAVHKDQLMRASCVILAGDSDPTGAGYMQKLWRELDRCYLLAWPDGMKDANQTFVESCGGDAEKFKTLVGELTTKARMTPMPDVYGLQEVLRTDNHTSLTDHPDRLRFPWPSVDKMVNILPGDILGVGSTNTGMGKSTWTLQLSLHNARKYGKTVLNYQAEMQPVEVATMVAAEVLHRDRNFLTSEDKKSAANSLEGVQYFIGNNPVLSDINAVLDVIEAGVKRLGADLVILDHFHHFTTGMHNENQVQAAAMTRIKQIAQTYKVIFINVGQPRKATQQTKGKQIHITDFKGSGAWGDAANAAIVIHRDLNKAEDPSELRGVYEDKTLVKVLKARSMGTGASACYLTSFGEFASFEEITTHYEETE